MKRWREAMARYYAEISYMDDQMGKVLHHLDETGQAENTIVIFLTEQGSNFPHCKWTCYGTGVRSIGLIRWPGIVPGELRSNALIQYVDILPTVIEAAGGNPENYDFDGKSFLPLLQEHISSHNKYAFSQQTSRGIYNGPEAYGIRTVRSNDYRLIWNLNWENEFSNTVTTGFGSYKSWEKKQKKVILLLENVLIGIKSVQSLNYMTFESTLMNFTMLQRILFINRFLKF